MSKTPQIDQPLFPDTKPAVDVEKAFGVQFGRYKNANVFCPFCESEETSKSPSCSVSIEGMFHCQSCGRRGVATTFYAQRKKMPVRQASASLATTQGTVNKLRANIKPSKPIDNLLVGRLHRTLMRSTLEVTYLMGPKRGLTTTTLVEYEIGCDERRITIPVRDRIKNLWGIRRYLPNAPSTKPKMVAHGGGSGEPTLYPAQNLDRYTVSPEPYVVLCEGEFDALILIQNGFDAITVTSGVKTWLQEFTLELLTIGKPVVIIYDVNDDDNLGQIIARRRARILQENGLTVKVVALPLENRGGDCTDWFTKAKRSAQELRTLITTTSEFVPSDEDDLDPPEGFEDTNTDTNGDGHEDDGPPRKTKKKGKGKPAAQTVTTNPDADVRIVEKDPDAPLVTLHDASKSDYFYKSIRLRCIVAGRTSAPYLMPRKVQAEVAGSDDSDSVLLTKHFDPWDGSILNLIKCSSGAQTRFIRSRMGIDPKAAATITVMESANVEEVFLIPTLDHDMDHGPYVMRTAFYVGHGLQTNQVYEFEGYTLPDPKTQSATHILTSAKLSQTDLDDFHLTPELFEGLKETFQDEDVFGKLDDIADQFADHITHIYGRRDLHTAIDLVFHSPLSFDFDGTRLRKGWLEILVLGDTRTGKGFVAEGLCGHYGVGEVVSAEQTTMAGLIGGIQRVGEHMVLSWGKIPLADKRLVVMDEASNLSHSDIGRLSRIRSEGRVEITKIITEKTSARTRLIWLSNPRPPLQGLPKTMSEYTYGVLAVPELIGNAEDVARFDYVLTVARGEVPSKVINERKRKPKKNSLDYTSELCRKLVVWVWSRKPEQVIFDEGVTDFTMEAARDLGSKFSSAICLIQAEDVRFKLARIACAAAGRTFSTDDGERLIVKKEHLEFAYNFLYHIYSKLSCGYAQLSAVERERSTLRDPSLVLVCLQQVGDLFPDLVSGLLEQQQISARDMCDYAGVDIFEARKIISELVRLRAITKDYHFYKKKPAFKRFLQGLKGQLLRDPTQVTVADEDDLADLPDGDDHVDSN